MSTHFNANQYEEAFVPHRLRNWEVPKGYREILPGYALQHPRTYQGCTQVIGTDRGHLMDSVARSNKNPWGDFVGTWDLPKQIPGQRYNVPTARSANAQQRLTLSAREAARVLNGADKNVKRQALQSDDVNLPVPTTERRSGAEGPASKMIPTSTPPGLKCDTYYTAPYECCPAGVVFSPPLGPTPSPPCPEDFYGALKSPNDLPATPPEVQKIPTPGMGECVTPPAHPPMVKVATPVMEPIRTPQLAPIRTPELKADSPKFMSPKALSPAMMNGSPKPPTPPVVRELEAELAE